MNTYIKIMPNVFLAKCSEKHEKGEKIQVTTKYGKKNECIIFNFISEKEGFFYYSVVQADGFNVQEWAKRRSEKYNKYAENAEQKSNEYYKASNKDSDFLSLGEPIKIGHHSEKRHRKIIKQANNNMRKSVEFSEKSKDYKEKSSYWEEKTNTINLSIPESIEYYKTELEKTKEYHEGLKSGKYKREHSFSLTYAKKKVNELEKKYKIAQKLWG